MTRHSSISLLVSALTGLLLAAPGVQAMELADNMYVVVSAGSSKLKEGPLDNSLTDIIRSQHPKFFANRANLDSSDQSFKLLIGHDLTENFAIEGGYIDLGKHEYRNVYSYRIWPLPPKEAAPSVRELRIHGWNVAALGRLPLSNAFSVFGKLGVLRTTVSTQDSGDAFGSRVNISENTWAANYGLGAALQITDSLGLRAEFERFAKVGKEESTGRSDIDLLTLGVSARF